MLPAVESQKIVEWTEEDLELFLTFVETFENDWEKISSQMMLHGSYSPTYKCIYSPTSCELISQLHAIGAVVSFNVTNPADEALPVLIKSGLFGDNPSSTSSSATSVSSQSTNTNRTMVSLFEKVEEDEASITSDYKREPCGEGALKKDPQNKKFGFKPTIANYFEEELTPELTEQIKKEKLKMERKKEAESNFNLYD